MSATAFLDQTQLAAAIAATPTLPFPSPPPNPVQGVLAPPIFITTAVVNRTQFVLTFEDQYFDSGGFYTAPTDVQPFSVIFFTGIFEGIFTGVTGAITFTFNPLPYVECRLGVGFAAPFVGDLKSNVAFDADLNQPANSNPVLQPISLFTQGTYEANSSDPSADTSTTFTGTDTNGASMTIQISGSAAPGVDAVVVITQQIVSGT
jgi:hypothetical protein